MVRTMYSLYHFISTEAKSILYLCMYSTFRAELHYYQELNCLIEHFLLNFDYWDYVACNWIFAKKLNTDPSSLIMHLIEGYDMWSKTLLL